MPTASASEAVAVKPNKVICFTTKRFIRTACTQIRPTKASLPHFEAIMAAILTTKLYAINMSSFIVLTSVAHFRVDSYLAKLEKDLYEQLRGRLIRLPKVTVSRGPGYCPQSSQGADLMLKRGVVQK